MKRITDILKRIVAMLAVLAVFTGVLPAINTEAATVKLNKTSKTLYVGRQYQLKLKYAKKTVTWKSEDSAIATVDSTGLVTAVKKGVTYIYATTYKGTQYKCKVTVKNPYVSPKTKTLVKGETLQLKVVGADPVSYKSSRSSVLKVSSTGLVTAVKPYSKAVTVSVACANGKTYKAKITVVAPEGDKAGTGDTSTTGNTGDTSGTGTTGDSTGTGNTGTGNTGDSSSTGNSGSTTGSGTTGSGSGETGSTGKLSDGTASLTDGYYGIYNPQKKTAYVKEYTYNGTISNESDFIAYMKDALENGAEKITFSFTGDANDWWNKLNELSGNYSILTGYFTECNATIFTNSMSVMPGYKRGWKAVVALKHTGYSVDSTTQQIIDKCTRLVNEAMAASSDLRTQILYINDALCAMAEYDYEALESFELTDANGETVPAHDATGVLLNGRGVCESYTSAMRICLEIMGVENHVVTNMEGNHIWNRVKVDGKWYHLDVTWNDGCQNMYFLVTDSELPTLDAKVSSLNSEGHDYYTKYLP